MLILMNGSLSMVLKHRDMIPFGLLLTPLGGLGVKAAFATDLEIGVDNGFSPRTTRRPSAGSSTASPIRAEFGSLPPPIAWATAPQR